MKHPPPPPERKATPTKSKRPGPEDSTPGTRTEEPRAQPPPLTRMVIKNGKMVREAVKPWVMPEPLGIFDLIGADLPVPPVLLEGMLHKGGLLMMGGGSKSHKTWSFIDLAVSVAAGVPFWDVPTTQGRVLYINFELCDWDFQRRAHSIIEAKGCEQVLDNEQFQYLGLRNQYADLHLMLPVMIERLRKVGFSLVVIDPIYKCLGARNENDATEIADLLREIGKLAHELGAAIVYGHHFSKGNKATTESIDRVSGSGVFARDADTVVTMTKHEAGDDAFTVEITARSFAPTPKFVVVRQHPLMVRNAELNPDDLKKPGASKFQVVYSDKDLLALLDDGGLCPSEFKKRAKEETGIQHAQFYRRLGELQASGLIEKAGGEWVRVVSRPAVAA